jgi:small subunit ribosomal protein S2
MDQISLMNLFEIGAHRGNSRSKLNPKLKSKIYGYNQGLCIIDLVKTIESINHVSELFTYLGEKRKQILIVGTSDHIKEEVPIFASGFEGSAMPYINHRWLGGTLTNWSTIKKTLKTLEKLENIINDEEFFNKLARNEQLNIRNERESVSKFFSGLVNLKSNRPGDVFVIDGPNNAIAIQEAEIMKVPIVILTNTSVKILSSDLSKTVVCNIYSSNTVRFITNYLISFYNKGLQIAAEKKTLEQIKN